MKFDGDKTVFRLGKRLFLGIAGAGLLGGASLSAQTYTWNGTDGIWEAAQNWDQGGSAYPNGSGVIASFGDAGSTAVNVSVNGDDGDGNPLEIGELDFAPGAPAYTFSLANVDLQVYGNGVSNQSSQAVTFTLASNSTLQFEGSSSAGNEIYHVTSGNLIFSGNATAHTASITVDNGGTVEFDDASTTGNATFHLNGGTLVTHATFGMSLDTGAVSGAGALVVGSAFTPGDSLNLIGSADTAFSSTTLQAGTLTMGSSGTVTLGDFSADGNSSLVLNAGTVALTASSPSSLLNTFTFDGGALCLSGGSFTFANTVTVDGGGTLILPHAQTASLGTLTGPGTLSVKFGSGAELDLGNGAGFTGMLSLDGPGTLALSAAYQLGAGASVALADGAALQSSDSLDNVTDTHDIVLNEGGGIFRAPSPPGTFTESGVISGSGGLTITGGTITLSGTNTYSGGTTILSNGSSTTLVIQTPAALGSASGPVTFSGSQAGTLRINTPGTLSQDFHFLGNGTINPNVGTLTLDGLLDGSGNVTFGAFLPFGSPPTVALNRVAAYTGSTTIYTQFSTGAVDVLKSSSGVTFVGANTLTLNDNDQTFSNLQGSTGSIQLGNGTLTAAQSSSTPFSAGTITGTGGVRVTGTGSLLLSGALNYSGATTVNTTGGGLTDGLFLANQAQTSDVHVIAGMLGTATYANGSGGAESFTFASLSLTRGTSQLGFALQSAGSGDSFTLTNSLTLTGSGTVDLVLLDLSGGDLSGTYTLLSWGSSDALTLADFSLDAASSPGLNAANLAIENNSLVYLAAPEPGPTFLLLGGGFLLLLGRGRLKQG